MNVWILGTEYLIIKKSYAEEPKFEDYDGYCDSHIKLICYCDQTTRPEYTEDDERAALKIEKETLRHEILHAYLAECGLDSNSSQAEHWATNEEMIDWIALQFPKIMETFKEADCL